MWTPHISQVFTFYTLTTIFLILNDYFVGINCESKNISSIHILSPAVATWYGNPTGPGEGGACGFYDDVGNAPYYGLTAAGNRNLFKFGKGCGTCYQVNCIGNSLCSGIPIIVTITNECPKNCNNEPFHFDLSGKAFGALAKPGQSDYLRKFGRINVQFQRVLCNYKTGITVKISSGSNEYFLELIIENVSGDGDIGSVGILSPSTKGWINMQQGFGESWKFSVSSGIKGPYSLRITTILSKKSLTLTNIIPPSWAPGQYYRSNINFSDVKL